MDCDHAWFDEVAHTPDIGLRAHRVALTYAMLSDRYEGVNWFTFGIWAATKVGSVIRDDGVLASLPWWLRRRMEPVHDTMAQALIAGMTEMFTHVTVDPEPAARRPLATLAVEQRIVDPHLRIAFRAPGFWFPRFATRHLVSVDFPNETLMAGQRVPGTAGPIGAPVELWTRYRERMTWMGAVIDTHLDDSSLKVWPYTEQDAKRIMAGEMPCDGRWTGG